MRIEYPIQNGNVFLTYYHYFCYIFAAWMITVFRINNVRCTTLYDYRGESESEKDINNINLPHKHISKLQSETSESFKWAIKKM